MTPHEHFAHRALVAAVVHGILEVEDSEKLIIAKERDAFDAVDEAGTIAIVASSPTADALVAAAREENHGGTVSTERGLEGASRLQNSLRDLRASVVDSSSPAYARALAWSFARTRAVVAPPLEPSRLHALAAAADAAGLALVVPDVALASPPLGQIAQSRFPRTAVARAVLHLYARGALAFPLLFVPHARAPKNGLPKSKLDRIADGWVSASSSLRDTIATGLPALAPLPAVAVGVLSGSDAPLTFKELLRAAREAHGAAGTGDAKQLASALYRLWSDGAVELFAIDPQRHLPFAS